MLETKQKNKKVVLDRESWENLKRKASFLDEILDIIEDKYLGYLMEKVESDEDVSFSEAEKLMK